jgi:hypothetical protein
MYWTNLPVGNSFGIFSKPNCVYVQQDFGHSKASQNFLEKLRRLQILCNISFLIETIVEPLLSLYVQNGLILKDAWYTV